MEIMSFLLSVVGVLVAFVVTILCYFLKGILDQMKKLNDQLLEVVSNQKWHYEAILELKDKVAILDKQINRDKK